MSENIYNFGDLLIYEDSIAVNSLFTNDRKHYRFDKISSINRKISKENFIIQSFAMFMINFLYLVNIGDASASIFFKISNCFSSFFLLYSFYVSKKFYQIVIRHCDKNITIFSSEDFSETNRVYKQILKAYSNV